MFSSAPALGFFRPARGVRLSGFAGHEAGAAAVAESGDSGATAANIIGSIAGGAASIIGSIFGAQGAAANAQGVAAQAAAQQQFALVQLEQARLQSEAQQRTIFLVAGLGVAALGALYLLKK